jgi:hypothetical protein
VTATYAPTNRPCIDALPNYRGAPVRRDAPELHASCDGTYRGTLTDDKGTTFDGTPCCCACHTPEGLPDWMRPQEGTALDEALATEARIQAMTEKSRQQHHDQREALAAIMPNCPRCGTDMLTGNGCPFCWINS